MNVENVTTLRDHLRGLCASETGRKTFSLNFYMLPSSFVASDTPWPSNPDQPMWASNIYECGTIACIAGHAKILADVGLSYNQHSGDGSLGFIGARAAEWMGITPEQQRQLFTPPEYYVDYQQVTACVAADVLDVLLETGEVIWPRSVAIEGQPVCVTELQIGDYTVQELRSLSGRTVRIGEKNCDAER